MYWFEWFKSLAMSAAGSKQTVENPLLERVCNQRQDFLVLVKEQHGPEISQSLVRKARRGQQFEAFYLSEMCSLSQSKQI
jgi:hypothetical protein